MVLPDHTPSRRHVVDHLGLVAGMVDALGLGDVRDRAPPHNRNGGTARSGQPSTRWGSRAWGVFLKRSPTAPGFASIHPLTV